MILLDTNLLTRMTRSHDPQSGVARGAIRTLLRRGERLIEAYGVTGFRAHDVRLVAAMQSYGISRLLTFNAADFRDLPVTLLDPANP